MEQQGKGRARKILRQAAGYSCIAVGTVGCVLPVLPGIPLLFAGLGLLAVDTPWAARLRDRLKETTERQMAKLRKKAAPEA
ncbi:MAG TPA: PGPGW domain-containing protein [Alloacidobacterium sp.]|nr:PGPGW domain-containing protein [Alloacidobacterium sp.]